MHGLKRHTVKTESKPTVQFEQSQNGWKGLMKWSMMDCGSVLTDRKWGWHLIFNMEAILRNVLALKWKLMRFWRRNFSAEAYISKELRKKCGVKKCSRFFVKPFSQTLKVLNFPLESRERGIWLLSQLWDSVSALFGLVQQNRCHIVICLHWGEDLVSGWWNRPFSQVQ